MTTATSGSVAVNLPTSSSASSTVTATSNAAATQRVTISDNNGNQLDQFVGSGQRSQIGAAQLSGNAFQVLLEYSTDGTTWNTSATRVGGPYVIGSSGFAIVVGENGDDSDYNDAVLQFAWKSS
ncbi:fucose-binding lectin II [Nocardia sp. NPDC051570]|uniref:fucose-binding lectin II n=1 Tax=Nocardia sp. NPDC051570 TaxID=3364324 RepID=UPI0037A7D7A3